MSDKQQEKPPERRYVNKPQGAQMKWKLKDPNNDRCGISDCGKYKISQYTQSGDDIFIVYFGGQEIGTAGNRDAAKRIARDHKQRETTA